MGQLLYFYVSSGSTPVQLMFARAPDTLLAFSSVDEESWCKGEKKRVAVN